MEVWGHLKLGPFKTVGLKLIKRVKNLEFYKKVHLFSFWWERIWAKKICKVFPSLYL